MNLKQTIQAARAELTAGQKIITQLRSADGYTVRAQIKDGRRRGIVCHVWDAQGNRIKASQLPAAISSSTLAAA